MSLKRKFPTRVPRILTGLVFCLLIGAGGTAFSQTLALSSATVSSSGSSASLNLTLASGGNAATGLQWTLQYSTSAVTQISATAGPALTAAGKTLTCASAAGAYSCIAYGINSTTIADGVVAIVNVTVSQTTAISVSQTIAATAAGTRVTLSGVAGTATSQSTTTAAPSISSIAVSGITSSAATITWTTTTASDSQVNYGLSTALGTYSPLASALVTTHSITLTDLSLSSTYYAQVLSRDVQGRVAQSAIISFVTLSAASAPVVFQLHSDATEVSGTANGSTVKPGVAPAGFTGKVVVTKGGSVNFTPGYAGNGVYFLNCCSNTSNAYYKFTGTAIGNVFQTSGGEVSFYLKSRYTFLQRRTAGSFRVAFDVQDVPQRHVFNFLTQVTSGQLVFGYVVGGRQFFYYVPAGTEDKLFGQGVILKVSIQWDGSTAKLYLNDTLVQQNAYPSVVPYWNSTSTFDIGATEYFTYGGYNSSDDIIDEFSIS